MNRSPFKSSNEKIYDQIQIPIKAINAFIVIAGLVLVVFVMTGR